MSYFLSLDFIFTCHILITDRNEDLESTMSKILENNKIALGTNAMVYVGRDTRYNP